MKNTYIIMMKNIFKNKSSKFKQKISICYNKIFLLLPHVVRDRSRSNWAAWADLTRKGNT
jgi:hypothetical protein